VPGAQQAARENRAFLRRVTRYLAAEAGITQFIDIGSGLPAPLRRGRPPDRPGSATRRPRRLRGSRPLQVGLCARTVGVVDRGGFVHVHVHGVNVPYTCRREARAQPRARSLSRPFVPSSLRPFVPSSLRPFVPSSRPARYVQARAKEGRRDVSRLARLHA
jgi:hypothetical protein